MANKIPSLTNIIFKDYITAQQAAKTKAGLTKPTAELNLLRSHNELSKEESAKIAFKYNMKLNSRHPNSSVNRVFQQYSENSYIHPNSDDYYHRGRRYFNDFDSIAYLFSDGTWVNSSNILEHPYSRDIPLELLPVVFDQLDRSFIFFLNLYPHRRNDLVFYLDQRIFHQAIKHPNIKTNFMYIFDDKIDLSYEEIVRDSIDGGQARDDLNSKLSNQLCFEVKDVSLTHTKNLDPTQKFQYSTNSNSPHGNTVKYKKSSITPYISLVKNDLRTNALLQFKTKCTKTCSVGKNYFFDHKTNEFSFHTMGALAQKIINNIEFEVQLLADDAKNHKNFYVDNLFPSKYLISSSENIQAVNKILEDLISDDGDLALRQTINDCKVRPIKSSQVKVAINFIGEELSFATLISDLKGDSKKDVLAPATEAILNLPSDLAVVQQILNFGLISQVGDIFKYTRPRLRKSDKYKTAKKMARHKGLAFLFLYSLFEGLINSEERIFTGSKLNKKKISTSSAGKVSSKATIEAVKNEKKAYAKQKQIFFNSYYNKCYEVLFPKIDGIENESIKKYIKKDFKDGLEFIYDRIISLYGESSLIFGDSELLEIDGINKKYIKMIYILMSSVVRLTAGKAFLKPSKSWFDFAQIFNKELFLKKIISSREYLSKDTPEQELYLNYIYDGLETGDLVPVEINNNIHQHVKEAGIFSKSVVNRYYFYAKSSLKLGSTNPWLELGQYNEFKVFFNNTELHTLTDKNLEANFSVQANNQEKSSSAKIDWFSLHPKFFFNGKEVDSQSLKKTESGLLEHEGKFYVLPKKNKLPSIKALNWFWDNLINTTEEQGSQLGVESQIFQLPRNKTLDLLLLRSSGLPIPGHKGWQDLCLFFDNLGKDKATFKVSADFNGELKSYQKLGAQWIYDLHQLKMGGILADDMGLGKTIQTIAFLDLLRKKKTLKNTLIVVPTSLTYNWMAEIKKFAPKLKTYKFTKQSKEDISKLLKANSSAVVIISYGLFVKHQEFLTQYNWGNHIYDEAHNLKNIKTKRTTAARAVGAEFKLCLSGTPIENHYNELYSILDLTVPGCLGKYSDFLSEYVKPNNVDLEKLNYLKLKIKPLVLRRSKKNILKELPEKTEHIVQVLFEPKQKKIYRDIAMSWNNKIMDIIDKEGESKSQIQMLTALLRLRQVCSDPAAVPGVDYPKIAPKLEEILNSTENIIKCDESVLIFTQFLSTFERLENALKKREIKHFAMNGKTPQKKRESVLRGFDESKEAAVFLMTLKTGGVGLNLVKANYIFHVEPWWNPAVENQATDRAHRIGQQKKVSVYRYLVKDSIEAKVEILKERKNKRFKNLFDDEKAAGLEQIKNINSSNSGSTGIKKEDFQFLLRDEPG